MLTSCLSDDIQTRFWIIINKFNVHSRLVCVSGCCVPAGLWHWHYVTGPRNTMLILFDLDLIDVSPLSMFVFVMSMCSVVQMYSDRCLGSMSFSSLYVQASLYKEEILKYRK